MTTLLAILDGCRHIRRTALLMIVVLWLTAASVGQIGGAEAQSLTLNDLSAMMVTSGMLGPGFVQTTVNSDATVPIQTRTFARISPGTGDAEVVSVILARSGVLTPTNVIYSYLTHDGRNDWVGIQTSAIESLSYYSPDSLHVTVSGFKRGRYLLDTIVTWTHGPVLVSVSATFIDVDFDTAAVEFFAWSDAQRRLICEYVGGCSH